MTPAAVRAELETLERQRGTLDTQRVTLTQAIEAGLGADHYDRGAVREARQDLARVVERLHELDARTAALVRTLPSPETIAQAERDIVELTHTATRAGAEFLTAAGDFKAALGKAERVARRLVALRVSALEASNAIVDIASGAGLPVDRRPSLALPRDTAHELILVALLLQQVAEHADVDEAVLRDLNGLRASRQGVAA